MAADTSSTPISRAYRAFTAFWVLAAAAAFGGALVRQSFDGPRFGLLVLLATASVALAVRFPLRRLSEGLDTAVPIDTLVVAVLAVTYSPTPVMLGALFGWLLGAKPSLVRLQHSAAAAAVMLPLSAVLHVATQPGPQSALTMPAIFTYSVASDGLMLLVVAGTFRLRWGKPMRTVVKDAWRELLVLDVVAAPIAYTSVLVIGAVPWGWALAPAPIAALVAAARVAVRGQQGEIRTKGLALAAEQFYLARSVEELTAIACARAAEILRCPQVQAQPERDVDPATLNGCVWLADRVVWLVAAPRKSTERYSAGDQDALDVLASMAKAAHERLTMLHDAEWKALHDPLTGCPNRTMFVELTERAIRAARRDGGGVAVLFVDLDGFKRVNDTRGHHAGDELLKALAARVPRILRASATFARLAGDEFAVLLPSAPDVQGLERIACRVLAAASAPLSYGGVDLRVTASIGIATAPRDGSTAEELLRAADRAMYTVKQHTRNAFAVAS